MKGSRKSLKILIVSKNANHLHLQLNTLFKAVKTQYLHIGPSEDGLHSQKLVFNGKIEGDGGPVGVSRGHAPLESEVFYHLKRFLEVLVVKQSHILNLPS